MDRLVCSSLKNWPKMLRNRVFWPEIAFVIL